MPSRLTPPLVSRRPVRAAVGASDVALVLAACSTGTAPGAAAESGEALEGAGLFTIPLSEADAAFRGTLPAIFG